MVEAAGRNIVLLSDGTGNSSGKLFKTNVWRVYDCLDLSNARQIASYDDGVGTSSVKPLAVLGGAFGWGLKRNVLALYMFLCLNYRPGDRVYAFGFSRGAFTIRVLTKFVLSQKLVDDPMSNDDLRNKAIRLYRRFRNEQTSHLGLHTLARPFRDFLIFLKDCISGQRSEMRDIKTIELPQIEFLGLWDTVDAYGLPVAELGKGVDERIWPLSLNDAVLDGRIKKACHALSIDDRRTTFHPLLWDESDTPLAQHTDDERLTQVWFVGAHANVGGGYPDDALSFIPLRWMIAEAIKKGLHFNPLAVAAIEVKMSPYGRIYNARAGLGAYYRYDPRRLDPPHDHQGACIPQPKIHETVVWRIAMGTDSYAPLSLPNEMRIVTDARPRESGSHSTVSMPNILSFEEYCAAVQDPTGDLFGAPAGKNATPEERARVAHDFGKLAKPNDAMLNLLWDTVWWRRFAYYTTLISTASLVLFPAFLTIDLQHADSNPITRVAGGLATGFLPALAQPWIEAFQSKPYTVLFLALTTMMFALWGSLLDRRIADRARAAWSEKARADRYRAFLASLRRRYATILGLFAPFGLCVATSVIAYFSGSDFVAIVFGLLAGLLLVVEIVVGIWAIILWRVKKKAEATKIEERGPGLVLASWLRAPLFATPYRFVANNILPSVFAFALIVSSVYVASRVVFDFADSGGWICDGGGSEDVPTGGKEIVLKASEGCQATQIKLRGKVKYRISISDANDWADDDGTTVSPRGRSTFEIGWHKLLELPLRRKLTHSWFVVVARIGDEGNEEYVLPPRGDEITPKRDGQLYLFVNDAVVGWMEYDRYYKANKGTAKVKIIRVGDTPTPPPS